MATTRSAVRPMHAPRAVVVALDGEALLGRAQHDERLGLGLVGARLVDERRRCGRASSSRPVAGDGRDRRGRRIATRRSATSALVPTTSARPFEQLGPVAAELVEQDRAPARPGCAPSTRREVEQEHEHPGPLDVAQELVAEARALGRALDRARGCRRPRTRGRSKRTTPRFGSSVVNG